MRSHVCDGELANRDPSFGVALVAEAGRQDARGGALAAACPRHRPPRALPPAARGQGGLQRAAPTPSGRRNRALRPARSSAAPAGTRQRGSLQKSVLGARRVTGATLRLTERKPERPLDGEVGRRAELQRLQGASVQAGSLFVCEHEESPLSAARRARSHAQRSGPPRARPQEVVRELRRLRGSSPVSASMLHRLDDAGRAAGREEERRTGCPARARGEAQSPGEPGNVAHNPSGDGLVQKRQHLAPVRSGQASTRSAETPGRLPMRPRASLHSLDSRCTRTDHLLHGLRDRPTPGWVVRVLSRPSPASSRTISPTNRDFLRSPRISRPRGSGRLEVRLAR